MKKNSTILFVLLTFPLLLTGRASAATTGCEPIYGGGENCTATNLTISKLVLNPQTNTLVPNLGINDPKYHPGDLITFQIKVGTTGPTIPQVNIKDTFPQAFLFSYAPGTYDQASNTLTASATNLSSDKPFVITIVGRIPSADKLPTNTQTFCQTNQASANTGTNQPSTATTQYCIQSPVNPNTTGSSFPQTTKGGLSVYAATQTTHTPPTGSETVFLFVFAISAFTGFAVSKKISICNSRYHI